MPVLTLPRTATVHRARAFVFEDPVSRRLLRTLDDLAASEATVLITGDPAGRCRAPPGPRMAG